MCVCVCVCVFIHVYAQVNDNLVRKMWWGSTKINHDVKISTPTVSGCYLPMSNNAASMTAAPFSMVAIRMS